MKKCMWCKNKNDDNDIEHIFPEAVGCPENFILSDNIVCRRCNNKLGNLDGALVNELDLVLFWHNIPRKKNKRPTINTRGNVYGEYIDGKKEFKINMTNDSIEMGGKTLGGYGKSTRNINVDSKFFPGNVVSNSFSVDFCKNKKSIRALHKIALSALAYYLGREEVMKEKYDVIRKYVISGKGERKVILMGDSGYNQEFRNQAWSPYIKDDNYAIVFRISYVEFIIDLSEHMDFYPELINNIEKYKGTKGWCYLPNDT